MTNLLILAKLYNMAMDMATKYVKATQDDDSFAEFITMFDKLFNQIDLTNQRQVCALRILLQYPSTRRLPRFDKH